MQLGDEAFQRLRDTIEELADAEVAELVAEARLEARARVRAMLVDALAQALLDRAEAQIAVPRPDQGRLPSRPARATPVGESPPPERSLTESPAPGRSDAGHPSTATQAPAESRRPDAPRGPAAPSAELGLYVYCVVGPAGLPALEGVASVDAGPLFVVTEGSVAAVASRVPLDQFGEESLRDSLNDVAWLEDKARAHERVLEHVRERATVIPMRLCTIYRTEDSLREMLTREREALGEALGRLAGRTEWGVKLFVDRQELEHRLEQDSPAVAELSRQIAEASEGEGYLLRRRQEQLRGEEVERLLEERCDDAHARLSAVAYEALLNPLQPREVTGHPGEMILNGVYLVRDLAEADFHAVADELAQAYGREGFDVQRTGPWPAYNFVKGSIEAAW